MTRVDASELAAWVRDRAVGRSRVLFGIAGPPGCGKSTLAARLAAELDAPIAPMDGYHLPNSVLDARELRHVKGAPETFDVDAFAAMLRDLRDRRDVWLPDFDRTVDEPRQHRIHISAEPPIVIVEGNYLLVWDGVAELLDDVGHVEVDDDLRVQRLIDRHVEFGKTLDEASAFVQSSDEPNAQLIQAQRHRADLLIVP